MVESDAAQVVSNIVYAQVFIVIGPIVSDICNLTALFTSGCSS